MKKILLFLSVSFKLLNADNVLSDNFSSRYAPYNTTAWVYLDFDIAMLTSFHPDAVSITEQVVGIDGPKLMAFFKHLYDQNNLSCLVPQDTLKIPKIIHQVWLGGPLPEAFKKYVASWFTMHSQGGWIYKLWTDEDMKTFPLYNRAIYDASDSVGVRSDIAKWEIVYKYGGVYLDVDFECLKPLDILHYTYDFYTAIQPLDTQFVQLGAALFGARAGHPILKHCIETIKHNEHKKGATNKTGPIHFTRCFYACAGKNGSLDIALPASYCYPLGCTETKITKQAWIDNGAYAVHHWAKSWMPNQYRKKEFRNLKNDLLVKSWNA
jgi:mannosyltransferase OCH1-like enzyme